MGPWSEFKWSLQSGVNSSGPHRVEGAIFSCCRELGGMGRELPLFPVPVNLLHWSLSMLLERRQTFLPELCSLLT